ncbi:MAG: glycosyltransferase [Phycisphaerae bacterium]|nr:glycosyltransferase [Phycisphaerae bacterium]
MPLIAAIPFLVLIALTCGGAVYYGVVLWRVLKTARTLPTTRDGLTMAAPEGGWPRVCVVVPAHNEERVIGELARSLVAQDYPGLRVVFSLDRCTDGTEGVLRGVCADDPRFEIVRVGSCPEGWAGKTNAAWRGVRDSVGARDAELLLFADADTVFEPGLVRASVALLLERRLDLLSLLSRLTSEEWFERWVQPAAGFELVRQYPLDVVNRGVRPRAFANGQFMLFRRGLYDAIGGHERVKDHLLEDIAFARYLDIVRKSMPSRWGVLMTDGMLRCRMYRDWDSFRRGWKRIYTEASLRRPRQLREWARRKRLSGVVLPAAGLVCAAAGPMVMMWDRPLGWTMFGAGVVSVGVFVVTMARIYVDQGLGAAWALTYPVGAWRVAGLLDEAARDLERGVKTLWGGREYAREVKA